MFGFRNMKEKLEKHKLCVSMPGLYTRLIMEPAIMVVRLSSFQRRGTKFKRLLHKDQHIPQGKRRAATNWYHFSKKVI